MYASVANGKQAKSMHIIAKVEEHGGCVAGDKTDRILSIVIPRDNPDMSEDESKMDYAVLRDYLMKRKPLSSTTKGKKTHIKYKLTAFVKHEG